MNMEVKIGKYVPRISTGFPRISTGSYWISTQFLWNSLGIPSDFLGIPQNFHRNARISTGMPGFPLEFQDFHWNSRISTGIPLGLPGNLYTGFPELLPLGGNPGHDNHFSETFVTNRALDFFRANEQLNRDH